MQFFSHYLIPIGQQNHPKEAGNKSLIPSNNQAFQTALDTTLEALRTPLGWHWVAHDLSSITSLGPNLKPLIRLKIALEMPPPPKNSLCWFTIQQHPKQKSSLASLFTIFFHSKWRFFFLLTSLFYKSKAYLGRLDSNQAFLSWILGVGWGGGEDIWVGRVGGYFGS